MNCKHIYSFTLERLQTGFNLVSAENLFVNTKVETWSEVKRSLNRDYILSQTKDLFVNTGPEKYNRDFPTTA